jgi:ribosomal protein S27E
MAETRTPLKRLECPNCTKAIDQFSADTQAIVCASCGSTVAIGMGEPELLEKGGGRIPASPVPIKLGDKAKIADTEFIVLGRVVYRGWDDEDSWMWNEWLLGGSDGRMVWMSLDETGFGLFQKMRFRSAFNAQTDYQLDLGDGKQAGIHERYPAQIIGAEGELTWRAKRGDRLYMAEGAGGGKKYSIQQTPEELEVYEGKAIPEKTIAEAFGNQEWLTNMTKRANRQGTSRAIAIACLVFAVLSIFAAIGVSSSGEELEPHFMTLSTSNPSQSFVVNFDKANRPAIVGINLRSGSIPANTSLDIDVNITAPDQKTYFLFTQELWHETGSDEDGPWTETHYRHSEMFVPLLTGDHKLQVDFDLANPVSSAEIEVTVRRNHVMPTWFIIYGVITGIIGFVLLFFGGGKSTSS